MTDAAPGTPSPLHVLIFTKHPKPGYAKTRLIPAVGPDRAAAISAALTHHTLRTVRALHEEDPRCHTFIHYASPAGVSPKSTRDWVAPTSRETLLPQCEGHLGNRLIHAFAHSFAAGAERAVVIGTDAPDLSVSDLRAAFAALERPATDVVLGPAADGGYYLLALRAPAPSLFESIPWSTSTVARDTRAAAARAGLRLAELRELRDVDDASDLAHYAWLRGIGGDSDSGSGISGADAG